MPDPAQVKRTREIESVSNLYFIHPISRRFVTMFARLGMKPNTVSALGIIFGVTAAAAYFQYQDWRMCVVGFLSMIMWHVMDGADGQLARLTGQTSELGRVMDGLCDHVTVALVYLSLAVAGSLEDGLWIAGAAVAAGISHVGQSSAYEFQRQMYDYWVHGKESARFVSLDEQRSIVEREEGIASVFARFYLLYLWIQSRMTAFDEVLDRQLHRLVASGDPDRSRARDLYRSVNVPMMRRWSLMSNNPRTVAIFLACLVGSPVLYFLLELTVMNVLLAVLVSTQRRRHASLRLRLEEIAQSSEVTPVDTA
ncbi:MAG: CDP-alcohol phosphatidyltransferase family protein [Rhodothermales bacterium]|nr:CDP-alcohol phosphatidyltransferase family protein [Rhodothermales bacterium]